MFDKNKFDKDGYLLIKNLFSKEEIESFRNEIERQVEVDNQHNKIVSVGNTGAIYGLGDLLSKPTLKNILFDNRIIEIAKKALGNENIVYFGDSSYQVGTGFRGWHRDNVDRNDLNGPDWKGDYTIIRMGLYLQNHKNYSGGLKVKRGSHINKDGKAVFIDNEAGDLVIWSLKTIHSGNAVRMKLIPNYSFHHLENYIPTFLKKIEEKKRMSLFMTFAAKSNHLDRYINDYMVKSTSAMESVKYSQRTKEDYHFVESKKVELMDVSERIS